MDSDLSWLGDELSKTLENASSQISTAIADLDNEMTESLMEQDTSEHADKNAKQSQKKKIPPALKKTPIEAPAESSSHGPHEAEASGGVGKAEEGGSGAAGNSGNKASSGSNPPTDQSSDENDWAVVGEVPQGTAPEAVTGDTTASLRAAVTSLEYRLGEREEELNTTREGLTNLQDVLEDFQTAREMERNHLAGELEKAQAEAKDARALRAEVILWKDRYAESEEAGAQMQRELSQHKAEIKRLEQTEEHLSRERGESRRLQFQLKELEATMKKAAASHAVPASVAMEIREQGEGGPQSRQGIWAYFGILFEPGPYGVPHGLTLYFFIIHFAAWWGHRRCY